MDCPCQRTKCTKQFPAPAEIIGLLRVRPVRRHFSTCSSIISFRWVSPPLYPPCFVLPEIQSKMNWIFRKQPTLWLLSRAGNSTPHVNFATAFISYILMQICMSPPQCETISDIGTKSHGAVTKLKCQ